RSTLQALTITRFSGLGLVLFGIPALCGLIAIGVMAFYPLLRKSKRDAMYARIEQSRAATAEIGSLADS
ncbi:MAG TPA: hypothetical protein PK954_14865, partial [Anaerolineales bacterium]|nr:hypothetical protein [Anaerolineales bacterium]